MSGPADPAFSEPAPAGSARAIQIRAPQTCGGIRRRGRDPPVSPSTATTPPATPAGSTTTGSALPRADPTTCSRSAGFGSTQGPRWSPRCARSTGCARHSVTEVNGNGRRGGGASIADREALRAEAARTRLSARIKVPTVWAVARLRRMTRRAAPPVDVRWRLREMPAGWRRAAQFANLSADKPRPDTVSRRRAVAVAVAWRPAGQQEGSFQGLQPAPTHAASYAVTADALGNSQHRASSGRCGAPHRQIGQIHESKLGALGVMKAGPHLPAQHG